MEAWAPACVHVVVSTVPAGIVWATFRQWWLAERPRIHLFKQQRHQQTFAVLSQRAAAEQRGSAPSLLSPFHHTATHNPSPHVSKMLALCCFNLTARLQGGTADWPDCTDWPAYFFIWLNEWAMERLSWQFARERVQLISDCNLKKPGVSKDAAAYLVAVMGLMEACAALAFWPGWRQKTNWVDERGIRVCLNTRPNLLTPWIWHISLQQIKSSINMPCSNTMFGLNVSWI